MTGHKRTDHGINNGIQCLPRLYLLVQKPQLRMIERFQRLFIGDYEFGSRLLEDLHHYFGVQGGECADLLHGIGKIFAGLEVPLLESEKEQFNGVGAVLHGGEAVGAGSFV